MFLLSDSEQGAAVRWLILSNALKRRYYSKRERERQLALCHSVDAACVMIGRLCGLGAINVTFKPGTNPMPYPGLVGHVKLLLVHKRAAFSSYYREGLNSGDDILFFLWHLFYDLWDGRGTCCTSRENMICISFSHSAVKYSNPIGRFSWCKYMETTAFTKLRPEYLMHAMWLKIKKNNVDYLQ